MRNFSLQFSIACALLLTTLSTGASNAVARPRVQSARVKINERGYEPGSLKLRKGVRARVTFLRTTDATCAKEVVLPDFNIRRALPLNQPVVVSFTPTRKGTFDFVCGMNMMRGQLIVQ
jgi:plastocyanin domain-containing protein